MKEPLPSTSRRDFLRLAAVSGVALAAPSAFAAGMQQDLRGTIDAVQYKTMPNAADRKSVSLQKMIDQAAAENVPVFLPPGTYRVSNLVLPDNTRITGVPGASRIVYNGDGHLFSAENIKRVELSNIVIDGQNRWLGDYAGALLQFTGVDEVMIDNCEIGGSRKHGVQLERCGGRIERSRISGAGQSGIYAVESDGLSLAGNEVFDCGNGGILVHRWKKGADNSIITGNRIYRIKANDGGTGQNGNGINIFRADNVMVANNHISDCAFTAIRANSASDIQITGNQCQRSGETAIYVEFEFEGAVVSNNIVDGAANGISIANFDKGGRLASVTGNVVRNLTTKGPYKPDVGFGIGIAAEADTLISGNIIEGAPRWGMQLGWGPYLRNLVVTGNIIRKAPIGCAVSVAQGAGTAVITDNVFQETPDGAVLGFEWDKKASGELATAGSSSYPQLTIERNRIS
ncbi:TIGR03808 family TAT-translocated repetitive protein [Rhizobium grahamii]|uniref:TIGR03808 family TAT-translocated repetitive protein n=1 Tax=Rhizobium grahamii TaxID=1120045 RepID=A0A5Q0C702_9HYPH|nr:MULTISPECIES: TIGR03808 family TAT-translocated repetitive protein [Rhizobium]QFY59399.1 TIGR03808 family TAT-translocated repetitive protein [Rhizobium grahamii]QRM48074.1 TIGR03808 family TAT-translocated repetitive protein [Rhizobium sp. BG6]